MWSLFRYVPFYCLLSLVGIFQGDVPNYANAENYDSQLLNLSNPLGIHPIQDAGNEAHNSSALNVLNGDSFSSPAHVIGRALSAMPTAQAPSNNFHHFSPQQFQGPFSIQQGYQNPNAQKPLNTQQRAPIPLQQSTSVNQYSQQGAEISHFQPGPYASPNPISQNIPAGNGGFFNGLISGAGLQPGNIQQLGQIASDIANCDPKTQGVCCVAKNYCDVNATCSSDATPENMFDIVNAIPKCACTWGFQGDGRTKGTGCVNINECETGEAGCEQICKDFAPGFACGCLDGFELMQNGKQCQDINECLDNNGNCSHMCVNTLGSYKCACAPGFVLSPDGHSCVELNMCEPRDGSPRPCEQNCQSIFESVRCSCGPGYKLHPVDQSSCVDRDECVEGLGNGLPACAMDGSSECKNLPGSYSCQCAKGYKQIVGTLVGSSFVNKPWAYPSGTINSNEELLKQINAATNLQQMMQNQEGKYGRVVQESAEHSNESTAKNLATKDLPISFGASPRRLQWEKAFESFAALAKTSPSQSSAKGVSDGEFADVAKQLMTVASTASGAMKTLQTLSGATAASQQQHNKQQHQQISQRNKVNAMAIGTAMERFQPYESWSNELKQLVSAMQRVVATPPQDLPSAQQLNVPMCVDIDECAEKRKEGIDPCNLPFLTCVNIPGSHECRCPMGFELNGSKTDCEDMNECELAEAFFTAQTNPQEVLAAVRLQQHGLLVPGRPAVCDQGCLNTHGSYECSCLPGYTLHDGGMCKDIDECKNPSMSRCEHLCTNLPGSFTCSCHPGYERSGTSIGGCVDVDECALGTSGCSHKCTNTPGSFICSCPDNLELAKDQRTCKTKTTCLEDATLCKGDFVCAIDPLNNQWVCRCPNGFAAKSSEPNGLPQCVDIDECLVGYPMMSQNPCTDPLRPCCMNISGGFQCLSMRRRSLVSSRSLYCESPSAVFGTRPA